MKDLKERTLKEIVLKEIDDSIIFSDNNIWSISFETGIDIIVLNSIIEELLNENKITTVQYNPYEERSADIPIGEDSYIVYKRICKKFNTDLILH